MFDIAFSELLLIALVALVVIGPERLPKVARTAGHLLGRLQRYVADVKSDISREMHLEELKKMQAEVQRSAQDMELSINKELGGVERQLNEAAGASVTDPAPPAVTEGARGVDAAGGEAVGAEAPGPGGPQMELQLGAPPASAKPE